MDWNGSRIYCKPCDLDQKIPLPFLWASTSLILVILRFSIASIILKRTILIGHSMRSQDFGQLNWILSKNLHRRPIHFSKCWRFWKWWNFTLIIFNFGFLFTFNWFAFTFTSINQNGKGKFIQSEYRMKTWLMTARIWSSRSICALDNRLGLKHRLNYSPSGLFWVKVEFIRFENAESATN